TPPTRRSTALSPAASRQAAVLFASAAQSALRPVQNSATSQTPAAARHSVVVGSKVSGGQSFEVPSQLSATSQAPAAGRQTAVLFASAGRSAVLPVRNSATSQTPAAARHAVVVGTQVWAGASAHGPVHGSA